MSRPAATVSVDLDPVDLHLEGYGHRGLPADAQVYDVALPRLLERFAGARLRATFFLVGRDAAWRRDDVRRIVAAGHEVASHSLTHPLAFSRLPDARVREETAGSRAALEDASGTPVVGFRAPNFDIDRRGLDALAAAGYRYDASFYPSPMLLPARLLLALKSGDPRGVLRMRTWPRSMRREPHRVRAGDGTLVEFPTSVTAGARFPVYHTMRFFTDPRRFEATLDGLARTGHPLSYALHGVDALGLDEDRVDVRLGAHPGMRVPLARKIALLEETFAAIARRFAVVPFRDRLTDLAIP